MDEFFGLRAEMEAAIRQDDIARDRFDRFERKWAEREQAQARRQMVDEIDEPKPQPVQQSAAMTPEQAKGWEVWCRSVIADELHIRPFTEFQIDTIAGFVCEHVGERIDALKTEIGQLRRRH